MVDLTKTVCNITVKIIIIFECEWMHIKMSNEGMVNGRGFPLNLQEKQTNITSDPNHCSFI